MTLPMIMMMMITRDLLRLVAMTRDVPMMMMTMTTRDLLTLVAMTHDVPMILMTMTTRDLAMMMMMMMMMTRDGEKCGFKQTSCHDECMNVLPFS